MRFVPVKSEEQQANGIVFRARERVVEEFARASLVPGLTVTTAGLAPDGTGNCRRRARHPPNIVYPGLGTD